MRFLSFLILAAVARADAPAPSSSYLLKPSRVFDGESMHDGWAVVVVGDKIESAGPAAELKAPEAAKGVELPGATLLPGLIEAHSHILLHPYTEASWNDQVARESEALRVARATNHLRATLLARFSTIRAPRTDRAASAGAGVGRGGARPAPPAARCWFRPGPPSGPAVAGPGAPPPSGPSPRAGPRREGSRT